MKHHLEHYDVPPEFSRLTRSAIGFLMTKRAIKSRRSKSVEKRMQFFLFPVEKEKDGRDAGLKGWRFVDQEGWVGVVQQHQGCVFHGCRARAKKRSGSYLPNE